MPVEVDVWVRPVPGIEVEQVLALLPGDGMPPHTVSTGDGSGWRLSIAVHGTDRSARAQGLAADLERSPLVAEAGVRHHRA